MSESPLPPDDPAASGDPDARASAAPPQVLPVVEERLSVERRRVEASATLRLQRRVVEHEVEVEDRLVTESVTGIQRVPIGRSVDTMPVVRQEGELLIVPVVEERVVTTTQLVLVEELHVRLERRVEASTRLVSLRRLGVEVERLDPDTGEWRVEVDPPSPR